MKAASLHKNKPSVYVEHQRNEFGKLSLSSWLLPRGLKRAYIQQVSGKLAGFRQEIGR